MWEMWDVKIVLPTVLAGVALYFTLRFRSWQAYVYLAQKWYDIQRISMDYPDFVDVSKTPQHGNSYESFARMCWGHAEDIYHHTDKTNRAMGFNFREHYMETLKEYKKLHYTWFERNHKFYGSKGFKQFVDEEL